MNERTSGSAPAGPNHAAPPGATSPATASRSGAAPGSRVSPGLVVAIAVSALMVFGIVGLVGAALLGDDSSDPTGAGLRPTVNVDAPATAPEPADTEGSSESAAAGPSAAGASNPASTLESSPGSDSGSSSATSTGADNASDNASESPTDDFSAGSAAGPVTVVTAVAVGEIEAPAADDLPALDGDPVEFPVAVTNPAPPPTFAAIPLGQLDPVAVPELAGFEVEERDDDRASFADGDHVVQLFTLTGIVNADDALERFEDEMSAQVATIERSPIVRLGAPSARFQSVAGWEYAAASAGQQGASTMSGAIVVGVRADGTAVVITSSRPGTSSPAELAADAVLLGAILART